VAVLNLAPLLAGLALAAHFYRAGAVGAVAAVVAVGLLGLVKRPWAAWTLQVGLALGAIEWVRTLLRLVGARRAMGQPAGRLTIILGSVAAVTLLSVLAFWTPRMRRRYGLAG
jgi:hypothetical protein